MSPTGTLGHSWLVKRDAATRLEQILPEKADLWTHICHSGAKEIAENGIAINTHEDTGRINLERNLSHYGDMGRVMTVLNVGIGYKGATNVFLCDIADEEKAKLSVSEDRTGYIRSCNLSPEHICVVLTVEDGKITDACTRDEFLDRFQENEIDSPWDGPEYGPERELEISLDIGSGDGRMEQDMALEEEEMELSYLRECMENGYPQNHPAGKMRHTSCEITQMKRSETQVERGRYSRTGHGQHTRRHDMFSDGISSTLEMPGKEKAAGGLPDGRQDHVYRDGLKKPVKKPARRQKPAPPVPAYMLVIGQDYDVSGTHTSVQDVEYTGYEIIGRLILYCFRQGKQPYKFSEYAIRTGGGIWESSTGTEIHVAPAKKAGGRH